MVEVVRLMLSGSANREVIVPGSIGCGLCEKMGKSTRCVQLMNIPGRLAFLIDRPNPPVVLETSINECCARKWIIRNPHQAEARFFADKLERDVRYEQDTGKQYCIYCS